MVEKLHQILAKIVRNDWNRRSIAKMDTRNDKNLTAVANAKSI